MKTKAVIFSGVNQVEIGTVMLPPLKPDEIRVEAVMSCLSPGTDLRILTGKQGGNLNWPLIPGYSMVGQVDQCGAEVTEFVEGDRVFCIGTQSASCELMWGANVAVGHVHKSKAMRIPDGLEWEKACLAKLAAIAYHGSTRSAVSVGELAAIIGIGPIGLFSAWFHQEKGADVCCADVNPARVQGLADLGLKGVHVKGCLKESLNQVFPYGADLVVDCTGVDTLLDQSIGITKELPWDDSWERGRRLLIQGSYGDRISLDYNLAFQRELQLMITRDHQMRDLEQVMDWMLRTEVPFGRVLSEVRAFTEAASAYRDLIDRKNECLTIGLRWS